MKFKFFQFFRKKSLEIANFSINNVTESQLQKTKELMNKVFFEHIGCVPHLKVDELNPELLMNKLNSEPLHRFMIKEKFDPGYPKKVKPEDVKPIRKPGKGRTKRKSKSYTNFELMMKKNAEFRRKNLQLR